jgi:L-asparagine transporter-like permease
VISIFTVAYMVYYHLSILNVFLRATETHLWFQFIISVILLYAVYHFIRIIKISTKMRKAAREQREAKSKRIEVLIFTLMLALVFSSLFYTVPYKYYFPSHLEYSVYLFNSIFQLLLLISMITSHAESNEKIIKKKQRYAATGAGTGLLMFYIYIQLMA